MRYVKLTNEQSKMIPSKEIGYTSGKRNKETGVRPTIKFCSSLAFVRVFGYEVERTFIEI